MPPLPGTTRWQGTTSGTGLRAHAVPAARAAPARPARAGRAGAARAAGTACARNPVPLVVPCHRVVPGSGGIGAYGGGTERKRLLLELEGALR